MERVETQNYGKRLKNQAFSDLCKMKKEVHFTQIFTQFEGQNRPRYAKISQNIVKKFC